MSDNTKKRQTTLLDSTPASEDHHQALAKEADSETEERPDFRKVKQLGWLPSDWTLTPLLKAVDIASGQVDPKKEPYISMVLVAPDHVESGTGRLLKRVTAGEQGASSGKYLFNSGDIVYCKIRPYLRKATLVDFDGLCSADMYPLRAKESVSPGFILGVLLGERFSAFAESVSVRSGIPKINRVELAEYIVALPPYREQRKIALILGAWDEALAQLDALIAMKEQRLRGLAQRMLTGEVRLPAYADEAWHVVKLGQVFRQRKECNRGDLPLLSVSGEHGIVRQDTLDRRDISASDKSNYLRVAPGDIAYNTMRMWQGVSAVSSEDGIVSPAYTVCVAKKGIDVRFAAHLFKSPTVVHRFLRYSQGLVSDTLNLKFSSFKQIELTIPKSVDEQKEIANVLDAATAELELRRHERTVLLKQKKGLMHRLITGEVRVKLRSMNRDIQTSVAS
ncbi:MAG: restriction endonuclease subunit S [Rhodothermales bacterium]